MPGYVFVSYSRTDRAYVEQLAAHLATAGVPVWYDYEIASGDRFADVIQRQIDGCAAFLVVMSPAAMASKWVRREIQYADHLDKPLLPLLLSPVEDHFLLFDVQMEDVTGAVVPADRFTARLLDLIGASTGAGQPGNVVPAGPSLATMSTGAPTTGDQARQLQASLVAAWLLLDGADPTGRGGPGNWQFRVHNGSELPVHMVKLWSTYVRYGGSIANNPVFQADRWDVHLIPPGDTTFPAPVIDRDLLDVTKSHQETGTLGFWVCEFDFRDMSGVSWRRTMGGRLIEIES